MITRAWAHVAACAALAACARMGPDATSAAPGRAATNEAALEAAPAIVPAAPPFLRARLDNGLGVRVSKKPGLPLVELRLVLRSGSSSDGGSRGAARIASQLLASGSSSSAEPGALERLEAMGARLAVNTTADATIFSLVVPTADLEPALLALATMTRKANFEKAAFERLRQLEIERVAELARADAGWGLTLALRAELFRVDSKRHPYARYDLTPRDLERLELSACEAWLQKNASPRNAFVVAIGDVELDRVARAAQQAFGTWSGREVAPPIFFAPKRDRKLGILLLDRPGSPLSELRLAVFGPERQSNSTAELEIALQILASTSGSRLAVDFARRKLSALSFDAALNAVAYGPAPISVSVVVPVAQTGQALEATLENLRLMSELEPSAEEIAVASRRLLTSTLLQLDTQSALAELAVDLGVFDLPGDHFTDYFKALERGDAARVSAAAKEAFSGGVAVAVAGDAQRLVSPLRHFGQVQVMVAERNFTVTRVLSHDPSASLDATAEPPPVPATR